MTDQIAVVVAVGPLDRAKSRLGPDLDANDRRRLVLAMLQDVLSAINEAHSGPLFVVTPDPEVDPVAGTYGALILRDAGEGTNAAIETAIVDDRVASAKAVLVVQGDLPQIGAEDLRQCLDALGASEPMALLVPGDDGGTSILGIRPPTAMVTAFGSQSGQRHRDAATTAGIDLHELPIAALAADVDTVDDLDRVRSSVGPATARLLEELPVSTEEGAAR